MLCLFVFLKEAGSYESFLDQNFSKVEHLLFSYLLFSVCADILVWKTVDFFHGVPFVVNVKKKAGTRKAGQISPTFDFWGEVLYRCKHNFEDILHFKKVLAVFQCLWKFRENDLCFFVALKFWEQISNSTKVFEIVRIWPSVKLKR